MSLQTRIGPECNIFVPAQHHAEQIVLSSPVLSQRKLRQIMALAASGIPTGFIDLQYDEHLGLKAALSSICDQAEAPVQSVKDHRRVFVGHPGKGKVPVHALLAT